MREHFPVAGGGVSFYPKSPQVTISRMIAFLPFLAWCFRKNVCLCGGGDVYSFRTYNLHLFNIMEL